MLNFFCLLLDYLQVSERANLTAQLKKTKRANCPADSLLCSTCYFHFKSNFYTNKTVCTSEISRCNYIFVLKPEKLTLKIGFKNVSHNLKGSVIFCWFSCEVKYNDASWIARKGFKVFTNWFLDLFMVLDR